MPLYAWKCECGREASVLRSFEEYEVPPTIEEAGVCDVDERAGVTPHTWRRVIQAPKVSYGRGWGGGPLKGRH